MVNIKDTETSFKIYPLSHSYWARRPGFHTNLTPKPIRNISHLPTYLHACIHTHAHSVWVHCLFRLSCFRLSYCLSCTLLVDLLNTILYAFNLISGHSLNQTLLYKKLPPYSWNYSSHYLWSILNCIIPESLPWVFCIFPEPTTCWTVTITVVITQLCPTFCEPMHCSLLDSSVCGIFQARILEWVALSFSKGASGPRDWTRVSCIACRFCTVWATREALQHTQLLFHVCIISIFITPPCLHWPPVFIYPTFSIYCFITRRNFSNHLILTPDRFVQLCLHHASETGFYICLVTATEVSSVWSRLPGRIAGEYWERFQRRWDKINPCLLHSIHGTLAVVRALLPGLGVGKQWVPPPQET